MHQCAGPESQWLGRDPDSQGSGVRAHASQGSPHIGATGQLSPGYRATESVAVWLPYLGSHLATRISKAIWS